LIIPGPDEDRKKTVVFFLKKLDLEPLLVEGPEDQGTDLAEKFGKYSEAAFAVTLLTGDDMGSRRENRRSPSPAPDRR
jgi:predicted nucleotide-binding protein